MNDWTQLKYVFIACQFALILIFKPSLLELEINPPMDWKLKYFRLDGVFQIVSKLHGCKKWESSFRDRYFDLNNSEIL